MKEQGFNCTIMVVISIFFKKPFQQMLQASYSVDNKEPSSMMSMCQGLRNRDIGHFPLAWGVDGTGGEFSTSSPESFPLLVKCQGRNCPFLNLIFFIH